MMDTSPAPVARRSFLIVYRTKVGLLLAIIALPLLLLYRHQWTPAQWPVEYLLTTLGYVLIVFGVLTRLWAMLYIGGRKEEVLQCTGPYSLVRHPLYLGSLLIGLGVSSAAENPWLLLLIVVYFWGQYRLTISYEERVLAAHFGENYAIYREHVPCFVPSFANFDPTPPESVNLNDLSEEMRHGLLFLAFIPLLKLVALLHEHGLLPVFLR